MTTLVLASVVAFPGLQGGAKVQEVPSPAEKVLSTGGRHTCAIVASKQVACWGNRPAAGLDEQDRKLNRGVMPSMVPGRGDVTQVSAGARHTCGVTGDGETLCWGSNRFGQLGDGGTSSRTDPGPVAGGHSFVQVSAGGRHSCAVTSDRSVLCWGRNDFGQLGDGSTGTRKRPVSVEIEDEFIQVSAGANHTCALTAQGSAWCWGRNRDGEVGAVGEETQLTPAPVRAEQRFVEISAGSRHTCALTRDGRIYCWGADDGRLGSGPDPSDEPVPVGADRRFSDIAAGHRHTCAVSEDGVLYCWGDNRFGQVGDSTTSARDRPVRVRADGDFVEVSAGGSHSCGVTRSGDGWCWGENSLGQLGNGSRSKSSAPVRTAGGYTFGLSGAEPKERANTLISKRKASSPSAGTALITGPNRTCGITDDRRLYCWGELHSFNRSVSSPVEVEPYSDDVRRYGGVRFVQVADSYYTTCGLTAEGEVYCWGANEFGRAGRGPPFENTGVEPAKVKSDREFTEVAVGGNNACALTSADRVYCWGAARNLGSGSNLGRVHHAEATPDPHRVNSEVRFTEIAVGSHQSCALTREGKAFCWGFNRHGQLGDGTTTFRPHPVQVAGNRRYRHIDGGQWRTCAVSESGAIYCWGRNLSAAGGTSRQVCSASSGSPEPRTCSRVPVRIEGDLSFVQVAVGRQHTCGLTSGGEVYCWGSNRLGRLGNGRRVIRSRAGMYVRPVPVQLEPAAVQITADGDHTCALTQDGRAYCWGRDHVTHGDRFGVLGFELEKGTVPGGTFSSKPRRAAAPLRFPPNSH